MSFVDNLFDSRSTGFDPFIGDVTQSNRLRASWVVIVDGLDVTDRLDPHLIQCRVIDKIPGGEAEIELDDRDATLPIPPLGAPIIIKVGWSQESAVSVFDGVIWDLEHGGQRGRGGGRRMYVHAIGLDYMRTQIKSPMQDHFDTEGAPPGQQQGQMKSLGDIVSMVGKNAGANITVHPKLAAMMRDHWNMANSSPQQFLQGLADEFGGLMHWQGGNNGDLTIPGENAGGGENSTIVAEWGRNLISWRVRPLASRLVWNQATGQHFDTHVAQWLKGFASAGLPGLFGTGAAAWSLPSPAPNQNVQGQQSDGARDEMGYPGFGRIVINGEPTAEFNGFVYLTGVRPGVDGTYINWEVQHVWARPSGFITTLEVYCVGNAPAQRNVITAYKVPPKPIPQGTPSGQPQGQVQIGDITITSPTPTGQ
jgi:hypothetical protein